VSIKVDVILYIVCNFGTGYAVYKVMNAKRKLQRQGWMVTRGDSGWYHINRRDGLDVYSVYSEDGISLLSVYSRAEAWGIVQSITDCGAIEINRDVAVIIGLRGCKIIDI